MSDLRVSFPVLETTDGRTSLDARSFRQAAVALASRTMPQHLTADPVYIVAPERRRLLVKALAAASAVACATALAVWLS